MRRAYVLLCAWGILVLVGGCGSTPGDAELKLFISTVDQARSVLGQTKDKLEKTVTGLVGKEAVTLNDFEPVFKEADKLRDPGKKLVEFKGELERIGEGLSPEQRKELFTEHEKALQGSLASLNKAHRELQKVLYEDLKTKIKISDTDLQAVQKRIWESSEEFLVLSRQK